MGGSLVGLCNLGGERAGGEFRGGWAGLGVFEVREPSEHVAVARVVAIGGLLEHVGLAASGGLLVGGVLDGIDLPKGVVGLVGNVGLLERDGLLGRNGLLDGILWRGGGVHLTD